MFCCLLFCFFNSQVLRNQSKDYDFIFIHAISVGAFNMTILHMLIDEDKSGSSKYLLRKIIGVIYDSAVMGYGHAGIFEKSEVVQDGGEHSSSVDGLDLIVRGIAQSLTDSKILFSLIMIFSKFYFMMTKSKTIDFYVKGYNMVRDMPFEVPTLLITCKTDPMSDYRAAMALAGVWKKEHSIPVQVQLWEKSKHAQHLAVHKEEYMQVHTQFLSNLMGKLKAKL